jgi:hypothetical protein
MLFVTAIERLAESVHISMIRNCNLRTLLTYKLGT